VWRGLPRIHAASTRRVPTRSDRALDTAIITAPEARDPPLFEKARRVGAEGFCGSDEAPVRALWFETRRRCSVLT